jgi:hypothetical protein
MNNTAETYTVTSAKNGAARVKIVWFPNRGWAGEVGETVATDQGEATITGFGKTWEQGTHRAHYAYLDIAATTASAAKPRRKQARRESIERCYRGHSAPVAGCHDCFDLWDA